MDSEYDDGFNLLEEMKHEIDVEEVDGIPIYRKDNVWSNSETRKLMELYKQLIFKVGDEFLHKKDMWAEIATYLPKKNARQCEQRFNTVLKRKRKGINKVYISEAKRKTIDCSKNTLNINRKSNRIIVQNKAEKVVNNPEKRNLTIPEVLLEISAKREEAKERRHKEKMEAFKRIQNIFQELLNLKKKKYKDK